MSRKLNILNNIFTIVFTVGAVFLCVLLCNERYNLELKELILYFAIGFLLSLVLVSAFHELGHLIMGKLNGFVFLSIQILFFSFYRENKKIKFSFSGIMNCVGSTEMVSKNNIDLEKRFKKMSAGGLLFSTVMLIIGIIPIMVSSLPYQIFAIMSVFLPTSVYSILGNGIPSSEYGYRNDGAVLLGIKKNDDHSKVLFSLLKIQTELYNGKTPMELDEKLLFDIPQLPEDDVNFIMLLTYRYMYYLDKKDYEKASQTTKRLLSLVEYMDKSIEYIVKTDALYNYCTFNFDADKADEMMYELENYLNKYNSATNVRVKLAYISRVLCENEQIDMFYKKAVREAKKSPIKGLVNYELKLLDDFK